MTELTNALTEKGNLKTAVQKGIREQASNYLESLGFTKMPNGKYSKAVASAGGKLITINLEMAVGVDTNFEAKEKASSKVAKPTPTIEVPTLFG